MTEESRKHQLRDSSVILYEGLFVFDFTGPFLETALQVEKLSIPFFV